MSQNQSYLRKLIRTNNSVNLSASGFWSSVFIPTPSSSRVTISGVCDRGRSQSTGCHLVSPKQGASTTRAAAATTQCIIHPTAPFNTHVSIPLTPTAITRGQAGEQEARKKKKTWWCRGGHTDVDVGDGTPSAYPSCSVFPPIRHY
jgi:hypothetical protein